MRNPFTFVFEWAGDSFPRVLLVICGGTVLLIGLVGVIVAPIVAAEQGAIAAACHDRGLEPTSLVQGSGKNRHSIGVCRAPDGALYALD